MAEVDRHSATDPPMKKETGPVTFMDHMNILLAEWHLLVFIFLGTLIPSLSLEFLPPQAAYIIRSIFQLAMFMSCARLGRVVVDNMKKAAKAQTNHDETEDTDNVKKDQ